MRPISKLPITLQPLPGEATAAFLSRTADANVLSPRQLSQTLRDTIPVVRGKKQVSDDVALLNRMLQVLGDPVLPQRPKSSEDLVIQGRLQRWFKQVCPACLSEGRHITHGLSDRTWAMCFEHRLAHVTYCPSCQTQQTWGLGVHSGCACGYDFRLGPFVPVDADLCEFLTAIANDSATATTVEKVLNFDDIYAIRARLSSTFEYFRCGLSLEPTDFPRESGIATSPFLRAWEEVFHIVDAAGGVARATRVVEARLALASSPSSAAWVERGNLLRSQVAWRHLADCTTIAVAGRRASPRVGMPPSGSGHMSLMDYAKSAALHISRCDLASEVRASLEAQVAEAWHSCDEHVMLSGRGEAAKAKIDSVAALAADLRQLRRPAWMKPVFSEVAEILSLIGCGVLAPWAPGTIRIWHIRSSELDRIAEQFRMTARSPGELSAVFGTSVQHSAIFDARASLDEWLQLAPRVAANRIRSLVVEVGWGPTVRTLRHPGVKCSPMPFGFCHFLPSSLAREQDQKGALTVGRTKLRARNAEQLISALLQAWEGASANVASLNGWASDSAGAARHLLRACPANGNPVVSRRASEASALFVRGRARLA